MSNDISSMFTKSENLKSGRKGYGAWKREKETNIRPCDYGNYVLNKKKKKVR